VGVINTLKIMIFISQSMFAIPTNLTNLRYWYAIDSKTMVNQEFVKLNHFDEKHFVCWKNKMIFLLITLKISYIIDLDLLKILASRSHYNTNTTKKNKMWSNFLSWNILNSQWLIMFLLLIKSMSYKFWFLNLKAWKWKFPKH